MMWREEYSCAGSGFSGLLRIKSNVVKILSRRIANTPNMLKRMLKFQSLFRILFLRTALKKSIHFDIDCRTFPSVATNKLPESADETNAGFLYKSKTPLEVVLFVHLPRTKLSRLCKPCPPNISTTCA